MTCTIKHRTNTVSKWLLNIKGLLLATLTVLSSQVLGQSGDLSQIRNGPADNPQKWFFKTFNNPSWVNGNAGAETAHYVEGMSIGYRSLLTGLTSGTCYEYVIEYDTYHGAMAIDYLTHFQRLEPHGPFDHAAEVIDPRIFKSGNTEYIFGVINTNTWPIPAPDPSGIASGSTKDISNQPTASFNALPAAERLMTIYNGLISDITYEEQDPIAISGNTNTSSSIRIRFTADDDSVVLAWGGHIASRLDWGFSTTTGKALSAAGISGSPYHMRQISMNICGSPNLSGFGQQDRSLSAAAVIPPPECPIVASQTKCLDATSFTFTIDSPEAGATYTWSFGTNTAGAAFSGGVNTGNSVTIVPSGSAFTAGSFTLNITALKNGITQECPGVATGTVIQVIATASANPTTIDITSSAHSTTLTADIGAGSSDLNNANYTYQWSIVTAGTAGSLTNATSRIATYTAGVGDAGSTIEFRVVATQIAAPNCSDDATVSVSLNSPGACDVTPQGPVCQGAVTTHNGTPNPKPSTATYTWSLQGFGGAGTTTSTLVGGNSGGVTQQVNATQSYRIVLSQVYENTAFNTSCFEDVEVVPTPSVTATYNPPACDENTFSIDVPNSVSGSSYRVTQGGEASPTYDETKAGTGGTLNFAGLAAGGGFLVRVTTGTAECTATFECPSSSSRPAVTQSNGVTKPDTKAIKIDDIYKIVLESPTKVNATPNPFTEKVRFDLVSGVSGYGTLELYNTLGQRVGIVYQGYIQAGRPLVREYSVTKGSKSTLMYIFKVGDQKVTGKLINLR